MANYSNYDIEWDNYLFSSELIPLNKSQETKEVRQIFFVPFDIEYTRMLLDFIDYIDEFRN